MTIYTPSQNDKDKAKLIPEVVTDSVVTAVKDEAEEIPPPRLVRVTFFRRNGRSFYVHLLFALAVLVILACGALGAVVFYRHLHKKVYSGKCGTVFFDTTYHKSLKAPVAEPMRGGMMNDPRDRQMDFVEEDIIVVEEAMFEELHTPAFDEVRQTYVRHDFRLNLTAIVEHEYKQCFVMTLNRSAIAPPRTVIDLLRLGLMAKSYLRHAQVIRQDFVVAEVVEDLSRLGSRMAQECAMYPTRWLQKKVSGVYKRSAEVEDSLQYAVLSNFVDNQVIFKINIHAGIVAKPELAAAKAA